MIKVIVNNNIANGMSKYRLMDSNKGDIKEVNEYLDFLAVRGFSERTIRIYAYDLLNFWRWIIEMKIKLEALNRKFLLEYIRYQRQQKAVAATTINHRLVVVKCLFMYHFNREIPISHYSDKVSTSSLKQRYPSIVGRFSFAVKRQPSVRVKVPYRIIVPLTHLEISEFFNSLKSWRDIAITGFMLFCGLRSREVISLRLDDIDITEDQVLIHGKGNKERIVPLPKDLVMTTNKYLSLERPKTESQHLFVVLKGPHRGFSLTPSAIRTIFRYHRKISGVPKANPHRFRHSFGTNMVKAGISLPVLMKLMGHAHIQTTMGYVNVFAQDIRDEFHRAINKLKTKEIIDSAKTKF